MVEATSLLLMDYFGGYGNTQFVRKLSRSNVIRWNWAKMKDASRPVVGRAASQSNNSGSCWKQSLTVPVGERCCSSLLPSGFAFLKCLPEVERCRLAEPNGHD